MTVVVKGNHIERIIVVDDLTASNSILPPPARLPFLQA